MRREATHDRAHVAQIVVAIRTFGWTNLILVDGDNGVIAGTAGYSPPGSSAWRR